MKFRNPETGEVFEDIVAARFNFCNQRCRECPISCWNNEGEMRCDIYCHFHPQEAANLMGYEVLDDTSTNTSTNQSNTPIDQSNTSAKKETINKIIQLLIEQEITIPELVDYFASEISGKNDER